MKKYFVIHSSDPYLLARICTDLQMEGYEPRHRDPFDAKYMAIYNQGYGKIIQFLSHNGAGSNPTRLTLTSRNYLTILKQIL